MASRAREAHYCGMKNFAELLRLITNLIRIGTIDQIDVAQARVRVKSGENLTGWLPWITQRAGTTKNWNPPTLGEQVVLLSPSGDLSQALILSSLYSDENPAPQNSADLYHVVMPDGTFLTYNHVEHSLLIEVLGNTQLHITGNTEIKIDGDATVNIGGKAAITAGGETTVDAQKIRLNGGAGVVTGAHICMYTGTPHSDCSSTVHAGK